MSSNGQHSASESGIASPESIATAMESINTLSVWLKEAGFKDCSTLSTRKDGVSHLCGR